MKSKNSLKHGILLAIALLFSGANSHADYQSDQDTQKAAQQLKDADDAQRADAQKRESQRQYGETPIHDSLFIKVLLGTGFIVVGGSVIVCIMKAGNNASK
jgi:hypothetical protein